MRLIFNLVSTLFLTHQLYIEDAAICDTREVSVTFYNNSYYAVVSKIEDQTEVFPIYKSDNLKDWKLSGQVFDYNLHNPIFQWANSIWKIQFQVIDDQHFQAYFIGREKGSNQYGIGIASSTNISGTYVSSKKPITTLDNAKVFSDPHIFNDRGILRMYWRETKSLKSKVFAVNLGLPKDLIKGKKTFRAKDRSPPKEVFIPPYDQNMIKYPFILKTEKLYYLFYTAQFKATGANGIGVARSRSPFGPFEALQRPLITAPSSRNWLKLFSIVPAKESKDIAMVFGAYNMAHGHIDMLVHLLTWGEDKWPLLYKSTA